MAVEQKNVLFVDDDGDVRRTAELLLRKRGFEFFGAASPAEAMSRLASDPVDLILLDLNFSRAQTSGEEGLACLQDILRHDPEAVVVVVTGHSGLNVAVQALRSGASDFIMKPWNNDRLVDAINGALATRKAQPQAVDPLIMVGVSTALQRLKATIDRCAPLTVSVLLRGETGTGKTLAALILHRRSGRINLTHVEASALTATHLADSANTTLVIENIERLPEALAPALLTWISRAPRQNCRLIATTTRMETDIGLDRGLTYAISTLDVEVPSLSDRRDDIVPLAEHFLRVMGQQQGLPVKTLSPDAQAVLTAHDWPDNIHALKHAVERAAILGESEVLAAADLSLETSRPASPQGSKPRLAESEKSLIEEALKRNNFNVSVAAGELGLTRPALYRRMSKYGL